MAGNTVYVQGSYVDVHDNEVVGKTEPRVSEARSCFILSILSLTTRRRG